MACMSTENWKKIQKFSCKVHFQPHLFLEMLDFLEQAAQQSTKNTHLQKKYFVSLKIFFHTVISIFFCHNI